MDLQSHASSLPQATGQRHFRACFCGHMPLAKAKYDDIAEQIESKKAKRELFKGFIRTLEKQDGLTYEFDARIWSSLVQEVIVKAKDDIVFKFKNRFEVRV